MNFPDEIAGWFADVQTERFVEVSSKALDIFGYSREEFLSLTPKDIVVMEESENLDQARRESIHRWGLGRWWTCRRKDGSTFRMQPRFHMQEFNGKLCYCVFIVEMASADAPSAVA